MSDRTKVATVQIEDSIDADTQVEVVDRLDDGNNLPGFVTERDGDTVIVYKVE